MDNENVAFYKERYERLLHLLRQTFSEEYAGPFICGTVGEKDKNGMPEHFMICPAYGLDYSYRYKRVD
jgi:hypothetical protein